MKEKDEYGLSPKDKKEHGLLYWLFIGWWVYLISGTIGLLLKMIFGMGDDGYNR